MSEGQQETEGLLISSCQPPHDIASVHLAPPLAIATRPDGAREDHRPFCGQHDTRRDQLVYAVCRPEQKCRSRRASRDRKTDGRIVREDVSDEMLLKHVAEGDKAAMHILFARHRGKVSRFIQRIVRNPATVDDLVSQVFLNVWRSASRFESRAQVSTWLLAIARFKAINALRERAHQTINQNDLLGIADAADTPETALDRKQRNGMLRACIDKLSPAHREVIDLLYYREKSIAEVSATIGIPQATAKSRVFYARKQLARMLVSAGFEAAAIQTNDQKKCELPSRGLPLKMRTGASAL